ncbi:MAG: thiamine diphosphokinase [Balneolaceae bacterium]|nr:MAG: thiamine diphosphokinase [Balneolaceae bacterium]
MRILILANGSEPSSGLLGSLREKCDRFVAADGGGNTALKMGFPPDTVIGDLDSFSHAGDFDGELIRDPGQETNDLEKALGLARSLKAVRVDVLGATGKRIDHTLKNLSVLQQFDPFFDTLAFYDDLFYTRILPRDFSLRLPPGHLVSLFPLSGKVEGIVTQGLRYPLNNEPLENGRRDGTSNETDEGPVRIQHTSGTLLFMTALAPGLL